MSQTKSKKEKELSYEASIARLEEISAILEDEKTAIDKSMELFEEAVKLIAFCDKKLKNIKQRIDTITQNEEEAE